MSIYHAYLIATAQTTREQLKRQNASSLVSPDTASGSNATRARSPYSKGVARNCLDALWCPIKGRNKVDSILILRDQYRIEI
jgi:hypothetical protein